MEAIQTYETLVLYHITQHHNPTESAGSTDLWKVDILPQHYTASQPRRPRLEISPPKKIVSSLLPADGTHSLDTSKTYCQNF
jgi:hypothetical protein